jgi:hypothetical protein
MMAIGTFRTAIRVAALLALSAPRARAQSPGPSTDATAGASQAAHTADVPKYEPAGSVAGRVFAEVMMGSGLATIGYLAGPKLAGAACTECRSAAGLAGANAAFPLGVYWGGRLVRGRGSFWLTVAAPWIVSATTFIALARDNNYDGKPALQIGTVGGALAAPLSIVLFELSNAAIRANRPIADSQVHVAIGPHRDGMLLMLARTF